jgi:stringent starvation protein B
MTDLSTRPYLIRAIYEWCEDSKLTPYLAVRVDERTEVPRSFVKDGEIVLNLGSEAVRDLTIGNDVISCTGRFAGVAVDILVPVSAVMGIFAKETGQGLMFQPGDGTQTPPPASGSGSDEGKAKASKPQLKIVK